MTRSETYLYEKHQFEDAETLFSPVEKAAQAVPQNVALRFLGKNISYTRLLRSVCVYRDALLRCGLRTGEAVTFALPNIPQSVYLLYGIAAAGLRAAPLHPLSAPNAVADAMQKTHSRLLFTLASAAEAMAKACPFAVVVAVNPAESLCVRRFLYALVSPLPEERDRTVRLRTFLRHSDRVMLPEATGACPAREKTAILLPSGGTTGTPKCIELTAAAVHNLAARGLAILGREKVTDCGMLSVLPVFHGFGLTMGVHAMLCHGGKDVLLPKFHRADAVKEIEKGNVQFIIGVPRLYEALLSHPRFSGKCLRALCAAFVGGDFVPYSLLKRFDERIAAAGGTCRLFEGYGLTETVTVCAVNTYAADKAETVGKPLSDLTVAAFDFSAQPPRPLPAGQKGELAVAGDTLMTGYLADRAATESVFFRHDGRLFVRTGDCGFLDDEGFVHFVSRNKRIVKVRGVPVYPLQIEQLACEIPGVTDACVVAVPDAAGEERLLLFVEGGTAQTVADLSQRIREKLSVFSVPKEIIAVPAFPRTNVSKTDAKELLGRYFAEKAGKSSP